MSSPPSCRILTISSSVAPAKQLACRIAAVSESGSVTEPQSVELENDLKHLPWTISNKYYTALVHFSFVETTEVRPQDAAEAPACIFVFNPTEAFEDDFGDLIKRLENSDFEVTIAVSVPAAAANKEDDFESFFGEHGFEYVNDYMTQKDHDMDDLEEAPGLGRIIDALSTILWPSMVQKSGKRAKARSMVSVPGPPGEEDGLRSLLNTDKDPTEGNTALQREKDALEKWLEDGADDEKGSWSGVDKHPVASASSMLHDILPTPSGFDDNFSDFVSASNTWQSHLDTDKDPMFPSQKEVASISQRLRKMGMSDNVDEGDSQAPFDLSRIMTAVDAMKAEIASITNEDEKRKAAAKVALGLVYGLGEG